jgi:acid phosphatase
MECFPHPREEEIVKGKLAGAPLLALALLALAAAPAFGHHGRGHDRHGGLGRIDHVVVIYEENHSFDNLYGMWEGVDGLNGADAAHTVQVAQKGTPYACLLQVDVNLTSPPLDSACTDAHPGGAPEPSHFTNAPFTIDQYIAPTDTTCPAPGVFAANGVPKGSGEPGGCTRDLVHRFYQEQYQLNGGQQNRYTTGSDAVGLTQGVYDTTKLPVYAYLHAPGHPRYVIADRFFQAAFGGSFLNHQWLIAAATPVDHAATAALHSVVDSNGMPQKYPLYTPTGAFSDQPFTAVCPAPNGLLCGDYAVNTIQPPYQPQSATGARLAPQTAPTIGDRLSARGVSWAWYSGGWSNANGDVGAPGWTNGTGPTCSDPNAISGAPYPNCPDKLFQFHHQPFNYFASFAPGTQERARHLRDEEEFIARAQRSGRRCKLPQVSFIKPIGAENEHPGYASEHSGSSHLVDLLTDIQGSRCTRDTMVVVTYDEFGGQWDHVPPPGQGATTPGPHDQHGPSTRIPALILAPGLRRDFSVDDTSHDTTSILSTIEHRFRLEPLSSRDAQVADLSSVFRKGHHHHHGRG